MAPHSVGSVWYVLGLDDAAAVILAGPFAADRDVPEYLVAPLYTGREAGFVWTSEDVRLEAAETGLGEPRFAAIWNARPLLADDLVYQIGQLTDEATVVVRDAYWASLNERPLGKNPRLGKAIRAASEPAAQFQARELERWEPTSGRVYSAPLSASGSARFVFCRHWSLTPQDIEALGDEIEESEKLVGRVLLEGVGARMVWFTTGVSSIPKHALGTRQIERLYARSAHWRGSVGGLQIRWDSTAQENLVPAAADSELAEAA